MQFFIFFLNYSTFKWHTFFLITFSQSINHITQLQALFIHQTFFFNLIRQKKKKGRLWSTYIKLRLYSIFSNTRKDTRWCWCWFFGEVFDDLVISINCPEKSLRLANTLNECSLPVLSIMLIHLESKVSVMLVQMEITKTLNLL